MDKTQVKEYNFKGQKVNIYDLFIELCDYIEMNGTYNESCSLCPLNEFCFKDKNQIKEFWDEVYTNAHGEFVSEENQ